MEIFESIFNKSTIHNTFFFNIKSVLRYPNLDTLKTNQILYDIWLDDFSSSGLDYNQEMVKIPDFLKIVGISYGYLNFDSEDGNIKRELKQIVFNDERLIIDNFFDVLSNLPTETILCGYDITSHDIPILIKRFLSNRKEIVRNSELPQKIKEILNLKPWDGKIIDINDVLRFKSRGCRSINILLDIMGLNINGGVMSDSVFTNYYWNNINNDTKNVLTTIGHESVKVTNLCMILLKELRSL